MASEQFDTFIHAANEALCQPDKQIEVDEARLQFNKLEIQYALIEEMLLDMAYHAELGFLSPTETALYEILSSAWARAHLKLRRSDQPSLIPIPSKLTKDQEVLFISRLEDKLDRRLELIPKQIKDCSDAYVIDALVAGKRTVLMKLRNLQTQFAETVSLISSIASRLFHEDRSKTHSRFNLLVANVLVEEAECLSAQATHLGYSIVHELRKPSTTLTHLERTKVELDTEWKQLNADIERLDRMLSVYLHQDEKYHELVKQYKECQQQLSLRFELLGQKDRTVTSGEPQSTHRRVRRSLSLSSLPKYKSHLL